MAETFLDVKLIDGFVLPYESGAEQYLGDYAPLWEEIVALFPDLRLDPVFTSVDVQTLADMVDVGRMQGEEPPDPFACFEVPCDDAVAEAALELLQTLQFIEWAELRGTPELAGTIGYGTNPETVLASHLRPAPRGVDAIYAWRVAGGTASGIRVADVELGWLLEHEDLITASITPPSVLGTPNDRAIDHGTAVMGIVLGGDNGVGIVGIAPHAEGYLVRHKSRDPDSMPDALADAGNAVKPGGVVLIAEGIGPISNGTATGIVGQPAVPVESKRMIQLAIGVLTFFGITVVEAAGNTGTDLDSHPHLSHLNPTHPSFVDSRAIVVGGADWRSTGGSDGEWSRRSSYGLRVDCFAAFSGVRAPAAFDNPPYQYFSGTSSASAIIAGMVCAIQGMAEAASTPPKPLLPTDIRNFLLRNPDLGRQTGPTDPGLIRAMPDLRKIANYMGWPRILPVAAIPIAGDSAMLVTLDDNDQMTRRLWTRLLGLLPSLPPPPLNQSLRLSDSTPAVLVSVNATPPVHTVFEVLTCFENGALSYFRWDTLGNNGNFSTTRSAPNTFAPGNDIAACRPTQDIVVVCGITRAGRLIDAHYGVSEMNDGDDFAIFSVDETPRRYTRTPGPVMVSRAPERMDVVAVDDSGALVRIAGVAGSAADVEGFATSWAQPESAQGDFPIEPRVKPGLVGIVDGIATVAVGTDGQLYACGFGLEPFLSQTLTVITPDLFFARQGQVGLGVTTGYTLMVVAVGIDNRLYAAFRPLIVGGDWSPLSPIDVNQEVSPLGGTTVVTQGDRVMVFAVLPNGRPCRADFTPLDGWSEIIAS
jgi:hypothetical protein